MDCFEKQLWLQLYDVHCAPVALLICESLELRVCLCPVLCLFPSFSVFISISIIHSIPLSISPAPLPVFLTPSSTSSLSLSAFSVARSLHLSNIVLFIRNTFARAKPTPNYALYMYFYMHNKSVNNIPNWLTNALTNHTKNNCHTNKQNIGFIRHANYTAQCFPLNKLSWDFASVSLTLSLSISLLLWLSRLLSIFNDWLSDGFVYRNCLFEMIRRGVAKKMS